MKRYVNDKNDYFSAAPSILLIGSFNITLAYWLRDLSLFSSSSLMGGIRLEKKDKEYTIQFSINELNMIYDVFTELTGESLSKWTTLLPKLNEFRSSECFQQWLITGMFDAVRYKAAVILGLELPETLEDDLQNDELFRLYQEEVNKSKVWL